MRWRVWFNEGLSATHDALVLLRQGDRRGELELIASDQRPESSARAVVDLSFSEPRKMGGDDYVAWCLQKCRELKVDLLVPGRQRVAISRRRSEFEAIGTRVLVAASHDVLTLSERKDLFYGSLEGLVPLPEFRVIRTLAEFDAAHRDLRGRHRRLCIKPAVGVFGVGFHVLVEKYDAYEALMGGHGPAVGVEAFRTALASARKPRRLLLMEYLPGPERSVDVLAHDGTLVTAIARRKQRGFQVLETSGEAIEVARAIVARHRLNGLVNVQTRDGRGTPRLLELNARMSGGLLYACASGVNLPWWSVALALGLASVSDVTRPQGGLHIAPVVGVRTLTGQFRPSLHERTGVDNPTVVQLRSAAFLSTSNGDI